MDQIQTLRQGLHNANSIDEVKKISTDLKKIILKLGLYKVTSNDLSPSNPSFNELTQKLQAVRDAFEDIVLVIAKFGDVDNFERNYNQLKPYYTDFKSILPTSENSLSIISLYLLFLLINTPSRLSDFHCEIEYLSQDELKHAHILTIFKLEQALMEGAYSRVLALRTELSNIPHSQPFTSRLESLVLHNILSVVQASCTTYPIDRLASLIALSSEETSQLVQDKGWAVVDNIVLINDTTLPQQTYSNQDLITDLIQVAHTVDRII